MRVGTVAQLARLEADGQGIETARRTTRKRLSHLESYGLVRRFINTARDRPTGPPGFVYVLTTVGARLTGQPDLPGLGLGQRKVWHPSRAFIDHWLAIGDLYVELSVRARSGDVAIKEFNIEGSAKRNYRDGYGRMQILRPDAFIRVATGGNVLSWFIEVDRATESPRQLAQKCRAYRAYELSRQEQRHSGVFPGVLFIVPDERHAGVVGQVIASQPPEARGLFWVTIKAEAIDALTHPDLG